MRRLAVLNVGGLMPFLLGPAMPRLSTWAASGCVVPVRPTAPALTCSAQATYMTGAPPSRHGIVGNGWYCRETGDIRLWDGGGEGSQAPAIWELARDRQANFTCASLFWRVDRPSGADWAVTSPWLALADGCQVPDIQTRPADLRSRLQAELGPFPGAAYWGPATSIRSSRWIAEAARRLEHWHAPTLALVYVPHLLYGLQRHGARHPALLGEMAALDALLGELLDFYEARGVRAVVLSEFGVTTVWRPILINRVLRAHGLLAVREERGRELLDTSASAAFAVADHQVAHVYVNEPAQAGHVRLLMEGLPGVARVLDQDGKRALGLDHPRAGDWVAIAQSDAWFCYYYWLDDRRAPDFARTVACHRKPGYDPLELFWDPALRHPQGRLAWAQLKHRLGLSGRLDLVPLDPSLVRGSCGSPTEAGIDGPVFITQQEGMVRGPELAAEGVCGALLRHMELGE